MFIWMWRDKANRRVVKCRWYFLRKIRTRRVPTWWQMYTRECVCKNPWKWIHCEIFCIIKYRRAQEERKAGVRRILHVRTTQPGKEFFFSPCFSHLYVEQICGAHRTFFCIHGNISFSIGMHMLNNIQSFYSLEFGGDNSSFFMAPIFRESEARKKRNYTKDDPCLWEQKGLKKSIFFFSFPFFYLLLCL